VNLGSVLQRRLVRRRLSAPLVSPDVDRIASSVSDEVWRVSSSRALQDPLALLRPLGVGRDGELDEGSGDVELEPLLRRQTCRELPIFFSAGLVSGDLRRKRGQ
jgi:hypothetical protein